MSVTEKQREPIKSAPSFKDGADHVWTVNPTLGLIDRVLEKTRVDLLPDDMDPSVITGLLFNARRLGAVLWEFCRDQAANVGVEHEAFLNALDGAAITRGWGALVDGIYFFTQSQSPKVAKQWMGLIEAQMKVIEAGAVEVAGAIGSEQTNEAIRAAIGEIGKEMKREIQEELAKSVTSSLESPTSLRDRIRSAN